MGKRHPDLYKEILGFQRGNLTDKGIDEAMRMERFGDKGEEEILSNFAADQMNDPSWWSKLYDSAPEAAKKLLGMMKDMFSKIVVYLRYHKLTDADWFKDLEAQKNKFTEVYGKMLEREGKTRGVELFPKDMQFMRNFDEVKNKQPSKMPNRGDVGDINQEELTPEQQDENYKAASEDVGDYGKKPKTLPEKSRRELEKAGYKVSRKGMEPVTFDMSKDQIQFMKKNPQPEDKKGNEWNVKEAPELDFKQGGFETKEEFEKAYEARALKEHGETKEEFLQRSHCQDLLGGKNNFDIE